ncbi:MAG: DnaJ domain-containing protein [Planctomycetes bacterium]|nr:DnaJ domain-containing protein [Planctomycetota bacterium]
MESREKYLSILDLNIGASADDLKKAFRELSFIWHPDRHPAEYQDRARNKFQDINAAYGYFRQNPRELSRPSDPIESNAFMNFGQFGTLGTCYITEKVPCVRCKESGQVAAGVDSKGRFVAECCSTCGGKKVILTDPRNQCRQCEGSGLNLQDLSQAKEVYIQMRLKKGGFFSPLKTKAAYKKLWLDFYHEHEICSSCSGSGYHYWKKDLRRHERRKETEADIIYHIQKQNKRQNDRREQVS